jgi:hypothetical protein
MQTKRSKIVDNISKETNKDQANNAYDLLSISQTVRYHHLVTGFSVGDTWIKAIKAGNYNTWPTITPSTVQRHFPESNKTQKGHMIKQHQGVRSTRVLAETTDITNVSALPKVKEIYTNIYNATKMMHSNQTSRFPATSSRGNKYIMVLFKVDGNYINTELMKNKSDGSMIKTYLALWNQTTASGTVKQKTHIMDNKASEQYKKEIQKNAQSN